MLQTVQPEFRGAPIDLNALSADAGISQGIYQLTWLIFYEKQEN
jgi:hypothetical protein